MQEVWKDVLDYNGLYQVSDLGMVKSLEREIIFSDGRVRIFPEKILSGGLLNSGYLIVVLYRNCKKETKTIHRLVWEAFNGRTYLHIDHIIEGNKTDNRLCNLQTVTQRQNNTKYKLTKNKSSNYVGVYWHKGNKAWQASIYKNGKKTFLCSSKNEIEAAEAYQNALKLLT